MGVAVIDRTVPIGGTPFYAIHDIDFYNDFIYGVAPDNQAAYKFDPTTGERLEEYDLGCLTSLTSPVGIASAGGVYWGIAEQQNSRVYSTTLPCNQVCTAGKQTAGHMCYAGGYVHCAKRQVDSYVVDKFLPYSCVLESVISSKPSWATGRLIGGITAKGGYILVLDLTYGGLPEGESDWLRKIDRTWGYEIRDGTYPINLTSLGITTVDSGLASEASSGGYDYVWLIEGTDFIRLKIGPAPEKTVSIFTFINDYTLNPTEFESLTYTDTHPKERPDVFNATLRGYNTEVTLGGAVLIMEGGATVWKGILEEIEYNVDAKSGLVTNISGRDKSVILWRKYTNRFMIEDDSGTGEAIEDGFFKTFYPHQLFKFLLYTPQVDLSNYDLGGGYGVLYRVGQGLDYVPMIVIDRSPVEGNPSLMIDRDDSTAWISTSDIGVGDFFTIDLGSQISNVMGAVVLSTDTGGYPPTFDIYTSTDDVSYTLRESIEENASESVIFSFSPVTCRYVKFESNGASATKWNIFEVFIYASLGTNWRVIGNTNSNWSLGIGTIVDWSSPVSVNMNINYGRLLDNLNKVMTIANDSFQRWEWWIDLNDDVNFKSRRGSDKSATISFSTPNNIKSAKYGKEIGNIIVRLHVLGKDWTKTDDGIDSGWSVAASEALTYGPYEKIIPPQEYPTLETAQLVRDVILEESRTPEETLEITVVDDYDPDDYEVGDDITITIPQINLDDVFRLKRRTVSADGGGGKRVTLILGETAKYRSYKDYMDRLLWMKKKIIDKEFMMSW